MEVKHTGNIQPSLDLEEHDHLEGGIALKKSGNYVWDQSLNDGLGNWKRWDGTANIDMATEGIATETTLAKTVGFDKNADLTITKTAVGNVTTFVKTDGIKTQTITINKDTNVTRKVWS